LAVDPALLPLVVRFIDEADEIAQRATRGLLGLEQTTDAALLGPAYDALARGLHTLKGSAAMLGLADAAELAHRMEDLIVPLQQSRRPIASASVDLLLRGLDAFLTGVRAAAEGRDPPAEMAAIRAALAGVDSAAASRSSSPPASPLSEPGSQPATSPASPSPPTPPTLAPTPATNDAQGDESWRVDNRQVVALMAEVERIRQLSQSLAEHRRTLGKAIAQLALARHERDLGDIRALLFSLRQAASVDADHATDIALTIEDHLRAISTVGAHTAVDPLQRTVRDLCRQLGKEARLSIVGAEIALDRRVLDAIRGPLLHLVRNAVDHGVETPAQREAAGKHREGVITIRIEQLGNMLFLEVADDGRGIDVERVGAEAVRREMTTPAALQALAPSERLLFIFRAGFSTAREVTDVSGRGVGLDVVWQQIQKLDGHVEVQSTPGQGTRFLLNFPAELGSTHVLLVRCADLTLGVPLLAVEAVTSTRALAQGPRAEVMHEEQRVPIRDLGALLAMRAPIPAATFQPGTFRPLLVIESQGRRSAVMVDEILGDQEMVVRPLPVELRSLPSYQGVAKLPRGELVLLLRADWLANADDVAARRDVRRALVIDDSLTARALHRTMLEAGGFQVHAANSAARAFEFIAQARYDVLVCDVALEGTSGLDLTRALRERPETSALPIILVSAHDSDEDRRRGLESGADGFLGKKDCAQGRLLAEVAHVISLRPRRS
jgi:chemotaxis protein histidine kinase CheA